MEKEFVLSEVLDLTKKLMKCKTVNGKLDEFVKAFRIIKEYLRDIGYIIEEKIVNGYPNLIISNSNDSNLDLIFCAHIDVVACDKYEPIVRAGKLYGRGSFDMKGQLAVILTLLKRNFSNKKIAFIITSDEEIGGACCKEILKEYNSKLAVIPDAGKNFRMIVEEKGLLQIEIVTRGIKAHASEPYKGENAILKSINIYNELLKIYKLPSSENEYITSINLSKIDGGTSNNAVADFSKMVLDIRFTKNDTEESILDNVRKVAKDSEIKVLDYGPMFFVDEKIDLISDFIKKAEDVLGEKMIIDKCVATSDAIYFSEKGIPTILINPIGDNWHSPDEYVEIDSLYTLYKLFEIVI